MVLELDEETKNTFHVTLQNHQTRQNKEGKPTLTAERKGQGGKYTKT